MAEWAEPRKWYRSLELFARYVMPQFNGSHRGLESTYRRYAEEAKAGKLPSSASKAVCKDVGKRLQK